MTPRFRIRIDGSQDVTDRIGDRLLSLRVTDEAGRQSDAVELRIDNRGGVVPPPRRGVEMEVWLWHEGQKETPMGLYTVVEVELSGPPRTLAVRGTGPDMRASLKAPRTRSWEDVSLGELVASIAAGHDLEARVGSSLRSVRIPHLDQTEESDLHLLTRLARDYDAIAKPAGGYLLFVPQGAAESATGRKLPVVDVRPEDCRSWRVTLADRAAYSSVLAHWHDAAAAGQKTETAGSGGPAWTLRRTYASAGEAREAARAKLAELTRETRQLSLTLSPGKPAVAAEVELRLAGFGNDVDGSWSSRRAVHKLTGSGYSTTAEAVPKAA